MRIENLNLLSHLPSVLPMLTRTSSILPLVNIPISLMPFALCCLSYRSVLESLSFAHPIGLLTIGRISLISPVFGVGVSLLADAGVFASAAIGSIRSLKIGITGVDKALDISYSSSSQRTVLSGIGIAGLASVAHAIKNIALGLVAYRSLDSEQQYFILKHRSIESLAGQKKNCRAVIIDGSSSQWGDMLRDHSWPLAEELYRNCDVRTYRADPDSNTPVCDAAKKGKKALRGHVDILAILGHGGENHIKLNDYAYFEGQSYETACVRKHLQPDAQMILASCNTATGNNSLAEKVSRHVSGIEVVGFSAYFNPYLTTSSWIGKKLSLWNFFPIDSKGNWVLGNPVRTFKSEPTALPQDKA